MRQFGRGLYRLAGLLLAAVTSPLWFPFLLIYVLGEEGSGGQP